VVEQTATQGVSGRGLEGFCITNFEKCWMDGMEIQFRYAINHSAWFGSGNHPDRAGPENLAVRFYQVYRPYSDVDSVEKPGSSAMATVFSFSGSERHPALI